MTLKTFNLDEETYKQYSAHCKENGISMSKQVEKFIAQELEKIKPTRQKELRSEKTTLQDPHHPMSKFC